MECEECDSTENVKRFRLFGDDEPGGEQTLCWDCRKPYVKARVAQRGTSIEREEPEEQDDEQEMQGQVDLSAFQ